MPRLTTPKELDHLVALIAATPDGIGIGIDRILQAQGNSLQRRTLQRRLVSLVAQGRIQTVGRRVRCATSAFQNPSILVPPSPGLGTRIKRLSKSTSPLPPKAKP